MWQWDVELQWAMASEPVRLSPWWAFGMCPPQSERAPHSMVPPLPLWERGPQSLAMVAAWGRLFPYVGQDGAGWGWQGAWMEQWGMAVRDGDLWSPWWWTGHLRDAWQTWAWQPLPVAVGW